MPREDSAQFHPTASVNQMFELYRPLVEGAANCSNVLCDGYAAIGAEWIGFVNRRLHTDLTLATRLAKCGSPQDIMQEWASFMNTAADDYRREFARLAEMNSATSQRAISAAQNASASPPAARH